MVVLLFVLAAQLATAQVEEALMRARIEHPQPTLLSSELTAAGYDVLEGSLTASSLDVVVSGNELDELQARGLLIIEIESGQPLQEIYPFSDGSEDIPNGYLDLSGINDRMHAIAAAYPAIAQVIDLTETYDTPATVEGRHLYALKISDNVQREEDEPALMIVSNHHAREIVTPVIALDAMDRLTQGYGSDQRITDAVDNYEIWIAPTWNPDGYNHVVVRDNMWRKNRRRFNGGVGVDQNRNYPQGWNSRCAGSTSPSSNTYKGPSAASEAETQTMIAWSQDQGFAKVIDYHSSGRLVVQGYNCLTHPFAGWMRNQGAALANASGYGRETGTPSAEGEHYEWQFAQMGAWSYLIETATQFQPSYNSARQESNRVWPGILYALERPISLSGHVTNARTGAPLEAEIELLNVNFRNGERNDSRMPHGRYHLFASPDTYEVQFSATGYQTETRTVTIASNTAAEVLDVELQELNSPEPPASMLYFSLRKDGAVGGQTVSKSDIVAFDGSNFSIVFDGSSAGIGNARVNAFSVLSDTEILMVFHPAASLPDANDGILNVKATDIVKYTASSQGGGSFQLYLDGRAAGLTQAGQQIDALAMDTSDRVLISVAKTFNSNGVKIRDEDLIFEPTRAGNWELVFDGSDVNLETTGWDMKGAAMDETGKIYLSMRNAFSVPQLSGANEDIFIFDPSQLGRDTSGTYDARLFFDGSAYGLTANDISALDVVPAP